jgi:vitamin B12 transporter
MKKEQRITTMMAMAITGTVMMGATAFAAEAGISEYSLDQVIVTATRYEKKDVDVPASTVIITSEKIKEMGAKTAEAALAKVNGMAYKSFGPLGASMGTMINEATIRGVDNGTLVMVNGNPVSWRGKYNLDSIPAESIERIEIVKGGGSVLYGSEAMSGVINIITKKKASNTATIGVGNYGQQYYNVNAGNEKLGVNASVQKFPNTVEGVSYSTVSSTKFKGETRTDINDVEKKNLGLNYNINKNLSLMYNYYETTANYLRYVSDVTSTTSGVELGDQFNNRYYTTKQHVAQINYDDHNIKASAYFNTGTVESDGLTYITSTGAKSTSLYNTREKNTTFGADVQKNWQINNKAKVILGAAYKNENYQSLYAGSSSTTKDYSRDNWGVYSQWEQAFNEKNTAIVSMRETWTTKADGDNNYNNFSAAGQFIHKLDDENNIYASVGQSFIMPTFAQMYGASDSAIPNPGLKPQTGVNYEIGWKKITGKHSWKAAIFHTDIKDNITATWNSTNSEYKYLNEDFKNTGIELSCDINTDGPMSYNYGVTYQNPQAKSDTKGYWDRKFGRVQLTGGVTYKKNKLTSSLSGSYLAARVATPSSAESYDTKPYFLTTFNTIYSPDKKSDITLTIDNVLDRSDNVSHSSSSYYSTPINFLLSYTYKF